jgi:hypothetical protein
MVSGDGEVVMQLGILVAVPPGVNPVSFLLSYFVYAWGEPLLAVGRIRVGCLFFL